MQHTVATPFVVRIMCQNKTKKYSCTVGSIGTSKWWYTHPRVCLCLLYLTTGEHCCHFCLACCLSQSWHKCRLQQDTLENKHNKLCNVSSLTSACLHTHAHTHTHSLGIAYKGVPCAGGHTPSHVPVETVKETHLPWLKEITWKVCVCVFAF